MTANPECPRAGRWIGGCKFEARYDDLGPDPATLARLTGLQKATVYDEDDVKIVETLRRRRLVRDVCTRCGRTVERDNSR